MGHLGKAFYYVLFDIDEERDLLRQNELDLTASMVEG